MSEFTTIINDEGLEFTTVNPNTIGITIDNTTKTSIDNTIPALKS